MIAVGGARLRRPGMGVAALVDAAGPVGRGQTVMTIFPQACPCSRYRMALGASLSG
jgi:hypothetical protein